MIGGGAGAAVLAALGYRAWDRGAFSASQSSAYDAWNEGQGHAGEGSTRPLHAAILASSAHNTQPWLFEPHDDSITVYADLVRNLGAADPFRRELYASIGCALYNLGIGAGFSPEVSSPEIVDQPLQPNPAPQIERVCEQLLLTGKGWAHADRRDDLAALAKRHTNRGAYQAGRRVSEAFLKQNGGTSYVTDPGAMKALGALIVEATERFIADPEMSRDSGRWTRTGRREIALHRDGVTVDTAGLSPFITAMAKMLPDQDVASEGKYWLASTRDVQVPTAAAFGVIFMPNRLSKLNAIAAGANWQALHLAATMAGLAVQPMNAPIEMMDRDDLLGRNNDYAKEIRKIASVSEGDPAFIFRIGYAEHSAQPSPRRKLRDVIRQRGFA
jgi:nitroreductase